MQPAPEVPQIADDARQFGFRSKPVVDRDQRRARCQNIRQEQLRNAGPRTLDQRAAMDVDHAWFHRFSGPVDIRLDLQAVHALVRHGDRNGGRLSQRRERWRCAHQQPQKAAPRPRVRGPWGSREQVLNPVPGDQIVVFKADSSLQLVQVDARLQRNDVARFKDVIAAGNDARRFVAVEADTVPGVMPEALARQGIIIQERLDAGIDVARGNPGTHQALSRTTASRTSSQPRCCAAVGAPTAKVRQVSPA